jgi:hypothetical protein
MAHWKAFDEGFASVSEFIANNNAIHYLVPSKVYLYSTDGTNRLRYLYRYLGMESERIGGRVARQSSW